MADEIDYTGFEILGYEIELTQEEWDEWERMRREGLGKLRLTGSAKNVVLKSAESPSTGKAGVG